ncbi:MAG TPA: DUF1501 domain-containing protein [Planctomycetaceae bacterium]|jgi:hypothetical protein|nr:DUF1501 domain-containing protein [Planctomycetaceae bacterium]
MLNDPSLPIWTEEHLVTRQPRTGRRKFLESAGCGLAALAGGAGIYTWLNHAAQVNGGGPVAPVAAAGGPKGKQLIFVFLTGGVSHVDTFDPKPKLSANDGRFGGDVLPLPTLKTLRLLGSPFDFSPQGESGICISNLFPYLSTVADDLCVLRSMYSTTAQHVQSVLMMHNGSERIPLPSIGSWLSYGLPSLNPNLPSYFVFCGEDPYGGAQVWDSNFLPPEHQGVRLYPGRNPIPNLTSPAPNLSLHDLERQMLHDANELFASARPGDLNLQAREKSFDTARGLMHIAPELFDLTEETEDTLSLYGVQDNDNKSFAWQCLMARRLIERGVRTVELIESGTDSDSNWDSHFDIMRHVPRARAVDQPLAGLIKDLKRRSLLEDTVVAICTEFGRTPWNENTKGRGHWSDAFTCLLVGGGVKGGFVYGATDEIGYRVISDKLHVRDYHATILHLLGIDHRNLTYRYAGRDYRLTDVGGRIPREILL